MKLLQLNATANWGSTGKIAEGIGQAAIAHGWMSAVAYGRVGNPSQSRLIKVGGLIDPYIHYAYNVLFDSEGLGSKGATYTLIERIEEYAPDIIHLHNIHDHWLNYPVLFKYLAEVSTPVVWTFHDCWAFTGGCYHFENQNCFKWVSDCCRGGCIQKHRHASRNFELKERCFTALGNRLNIVCVSDWLAKYVCQSFLGKSALIHTVKNGIDLHGAFQLSRHPKREMILGVSNIWPEYKGLGDFKKLRQMLPDNIEIVLVGLSERQIKELPSGIRGMGRTSSVEELAKLYGEASVFVNPTHNDTFPTVNLEALACGTPVVTYRTGGSPEAIDGNTGIVVDKADVRSLADAIMMVINNPQQFSSDNCRKRVESNFDRDKQFGKYIDLYTHLLEN